MGATRWVDSMKRFLLFAGDCYYPEGGAEDFIGGCDTMEEAETLLLGNDDDWGKPSCRYRNASSQWANVLDPATGVVLARDCATGEWVSPNELTERLRA